jgi:ATP-dependent protease ClpP protease subunit
MARYIFYHGVVSGQGIRNLETLLLAAANDRIEEVTVCICICIYICSAGGEVDAGLGFYNFAGMLPIKVDTHCFGICGSIATTMYIAGHKRTTAKTSRFSLHASTYTNGPRKGEIAENTALMSEPFRTQLGWGDQ